MTSHPSRSLRQMVYTLGGLGLAAIATVVLLLLIQGADPAQGTALFWRILLFSSPVLLCSLVLGVVHTLFGLRKI